MSAVASDRKATFDQGQQTGPWDDPLTKLQEWDSAWAEQCFNMTTNPWTNGILPRKTIELICIAVDAGATREEILTVLKMASLLGIHSCSLGAPILLEEAKAAGVEPRSKNKVPTPVCDKAREVGQWNTAWDPFFNLDPLWTEQFISTGLPIYMGALIPPKLAELLSIAFDVSYTHMYTPGTRRHIKAALKLGATMEEIMEVLKLCVVQGVQALNLGIPILDEELKRNSR
jgi:alkylhydroperoxidase/carboxymuconolactone decarboxylase family protein YurZ